MHILLGMYGPWALQELFVRFKYNTKLVTEAPLLPDSGLPCMGKVIFSAKFCHFGPPLWVQILWPKNTANGSLQSKLFCEFLKWGNYDFSGPSELNLESLLCHKLKLHLGLFVNF